MESIMQPYHQREARQRTLSPMCIAETVTEDLPRLAAVMLPRGLDKFYDYTSCLSSRVRMVCCCFGVL